jgi:hypothetical protein
MSQSVHVSAVQRLKEVLDVLREGETTKGPTEHTVTQSVVTGAAALLGAFLGQSFNCKLYPISSLDIVQSKLEVIVGSELIPY